MCSSVRTLLLNGVHATRRGVRGARDGTVVQNSSSALGHLAARGGDRAAHGVDGGILVGIGVIMQLSMCTHVVNE